MTTQGQDDAFRQSAAIVFLLAPLGTAIAPKLTTVFLPLLVVVLISPAMWHSPRWWKAISQSASLAACLALSLYAFLNATWSWNPASALAKVAILLGLVLAILLVRSAVGALTEPQSRAFSIAFIVGAGLAIVYLLIEVFTDNAITRGAYNTFPAIRPDNTKRIELADNIVTRVNLNTLNQGVAIAMFNLWPALLMLTATPDHRRKWAVGALFFAATAFVVFASEHSSSQMALLGSAIVFALAYKWSRVVLRMLSVLWCLAFLLVLPASFLAHDAGLHAHPSLPYSFRARVVLWNYTAERTLDHPWLGIGVNSTREMGVASQKVLTPAQKEGFRIRKEAGDVTIYRTTGHHTHSLYLQTWFELGAVGAALFALAGALVILRAETLPRDLHPYAAAAFATFALIAAFAWGMWQTWWMCAVGLLALYLCLGFQRGESRAHL